jgi:predicted metalloprotease with PDZ domain
LLLAILLLATAGQADAWARAGADDPRTGQAHAQAVSHTLSFERRSQQYVAVESSFPSEGLQTEIVLANWAPGSYRIRNFAANVEGIEARAGSGERLTVHKVSKNRWRIDHPPNERLVVSYRSWAGELSVVANWAEDAFALINPVSLLFFTASSRAMPQQLDIELPADWSVVATSLPRTVESPPEAVRVRADDFDELADSPMLLGNPPVHLVSRDGPDIFLVNQGEDSMWDAAAAVRDLRAMVNAHLEFWRGNPFHRDYYFLNILNGGNAGLEHDHSSVTTGHPWAMRKREEYIRWLALMSHEFFHAWNVRRLRPARLVEYDYERENYTRELWLAEGLTSYYDNLLLFRSGAITVDELLRLLAREIQQYEIMPGRDVRSAELASFDAWIKHYHPDANTINSTTSYYRKGALIGLVVDIGVRKATNDRKSLDDVMRAMYLDYGPEGRVGVGYPPGAFEARIESLAGVESRQWIDSLVGTTADPDVDAALEWLGLKLDRGLSTRPAGLGVTWKKDSSRLLVNEVIHGGAGAEAGLLPGDEVLAIDGLRVDPSSIQDTVSRLRAGDEVGLLIARHGRVRDIAATVADAVTSEYVIRSDGRINRREQTRLENWLGKPLQVAR